MTLIRFDPFRELDRVTEQVLGGVRALRTTLAMDAYRRGDQFLVEVDLPGVDPEDVDVTVERNVVNIRARRASEHDEGDEILANERPEGEFVRQLFLGDNLDASQLSATLENGVLRLVIPVSETSKPRRVEVAGREHRRLIQSGQSAEAGQSSDQEQRQTTKA